jgi:acetyl-CoA acetyltransferase
MRTPFGRRNGGLSGMHWVDLLGRVQRVVLDGAGVNPAGVGHVVAGCAAQVGVQAFNTGRGTGLTARLPRTVAATTIDTQYGSSRQAVNLGHSLTASGAAKAGAPVFGACTCWCPFVGGPWRGRCLVRATRGWLKTSSLNRLPCFYKSSRCIR